jgi:hypothetical protein
MVEILHTCVCLHVDKRRALEKSKEVKWLGGSADPLHWHRPPPMVGWGLVHPSYVCKCWWGYLEISCMWIVGPSIHVKAFLAVQRKHKLHLDYVSLLHTRIELPEPQMGCNLRYWANQSQFCSFCPYIQIECMYMWNQDICTNLSMFFSFYSIYDTLLIVSIIQNHDEMTVNITCNCITCTSHLPFVAFISRST